MTRAIETTATLDREGRLCLATPLALDLPREVRLIVLVDDDGEPAERAWLRSARANPAFGFLSHPAEDLYSPEDGVPVGGETPDA